MTARYLAVKALVRQEQDGYANLVLDAELSRCRPPLESRDAAFAARIFYTVLERRNLLDWTLNRFLKKPVHKLDAPVRAILRAGLAQASYMEVPLPAAVNESVKLTRAFGKTSAAGMVNAVLRRAAACKPIPEEFPDLVDRLQTYYSLSAPVADLLLQQYGEEAEAIAEAFYLPAPTWVRVNTLKTDAAALTEHLTREGCTVEPGPWANCLRVQFPGSPAATKAFQQGLFHVQGLASQFAADSVKVAPGMRVLDLCAAPGGKSLTMAQAMQDRGELYSGEAVASRVPLLKKAFARCGVTCAHPFQGDASQPSEKLAEKPFDRILCDVPCSGLGVIGKKPDIRYKDLNGLDALVCLQKKILQNGSKYLAETGRLVYSTCTVNQNENEEVVRQFLQDNPDFTVVPPENLPLSGRQTPYGTLFLPGQAGFDGFFVAVLERNA